MRFRFMLGNLGHNYGLSREADCRFSGANNKVEAFLPGVLPAGRTFYQRSNLPETLQWQR